MKLVYLTTQDITKAKPITDSRVISDKFGKRHDNLIRKIEAIINSGESEFFTKLKIEVCFENSDLQNGKPQKFYQLDEAQTMYLIMGFTGKEAGAFKDQFIKQFQFMRHELLARTETRSIGKFCRRSITDMIDKTLEDGTSHKKFAYSNYSKLIYKRVLGCTVKVAKERRNIPVEANLRDHLTIDELNEVQSMETKAATMIETMHALGISDKEIYAKIKEMI